MNQSRKISVNYFKMKYHFPNPDGNEWISKYNELVDMIANDEAYWKEYKKTQPKRNDKDPNVWKNSKAVTIHHIIPKKINPELVKDPNNLLFVPFKEHCDLHYFLWRTNPEYAAHLWWIALAGRKLCLWDLPNGEPEYRQLSKDLALCRKKSKNN